MTCSFVFINQSTYHSLVQWVHYQPCSNTTSFPAMFRRFSFSLFLASTWMALYVSSYKYDCFIELSLRKEILEKGPDSPEFPQTHVDTVVYQYWKQKEVGGMLRSIIHPSIRDAIVWKWMKLKNRSVESNQRNSPGSTSSKTMWAPPLSLICSSCSLLVNR